VTDWRLAVDIGGTFTDVVLLDASDGSVLVEKTLTTPDNPLRGVQRGVAGLLAKASVKASAIQAPIVHATTLVTNALIEGKSASAALVTTAGFGDTMLIRDEHRYDMYDLQIEYPPPPIPRQRTFEIAERTLCDGTIRSAPTAAGLAALAGQLREQAVDAVAVCLINAYANPANERSVARALSSLGVPVCTSSEVAPQIREYPRMVTTACNAATMPLVASYLAELRDWLAEVAFSGGLMIMLSNGGVVSSDMAERCPIRLVESGPAAGALAGMWYARKLDQPRLLCLDMGGTTAKACLVENFRALLTPDFEVARRYRFKKGSGFPVTIPSIDLVEIGAGGGSIAQVDDLGLLKVGPQSAGADPGPACYGAAGTEPTVTDADVVLGYIDPANFLGGDMRLDAAAAEQAVGKLADILKIPAADAAHGIHELVNQNMAAAARMHAIERGADLRGIPVAAFGGAGPAHACGLAELLDSPEVIFPANASVLSALGTLVTPVRIDLARSLVRILTDSEDPEREEVIEELRAEGRRVLAAAGVPGTDIGFRYGIDARYHGQGNEITIWLGEGEGWEVTAQSAITEFSREYERVYGMSIPGVPVEVVTWRVSAFAGDPALTMIEPGGHPRAGGHAAAAVGRQVRFWRAAPPEETPVYQRQALEPGMRIGGPAVVEERETTIVIRPGWSASVRPDRSLVATRAALWMPSSLRCCGAASSAPSTSRPRRCSGPRSARSSARPATWPTACSTGGHAWSPRQSPARQGTSTHSPWPPGSSSPNTPSRRWSPAMC
jgi:N-methylhydantoinase A